MKNHIKIALVSSIALLAVNSFAAVTPFASSSKRQILGSAFPEGEKAIYLRILEAYRKGSVEETTKFKDLMLKNYSRSIYADNAIYLSGLVNFQRGRTAEAIENFGELIKKYPNGNKRPAAMYAKSVAYSKLNLRNLAKKILEDITARYPGSPESQRAWIDLRLKEKKG